MSAPTIKIKLNKLLTDTLHYQIISNQTPLLVAFPLQASLISITEQLPKLTALTLGMGQATDLSFLTALTWYGHVSESIMP